MAAEEAAAAAAAAAERRTRHRRRGAWARLAAPACLLVAVLAALASAPSPASADFICTQTLKAKFRSLFVVQRTWMAAEDTAQLCELCTKVARYSILYANDADTRPKWAETVRDNACTYAERHRESDCELLVDAVVDRESAYFTSDKVKLVKDELTNTLTTAIALDARARQFCVETMCCPTMAAAANNGTAPAADGQQQQQAAAPSSSSSSLQPNSAPPGAATTGAGAAKNGTKTAVDARSVHANRTAEEIKSELEQDRVILDAEKRTFDHRAAFLDAYRSRLEKREKELKIAQQEVELEKKKIAQGVVKKQMEKKLAEEEEKRASTAAKREEERKEEDAAAKRKAEGKDEIEAEAAKKIAAASDADEGQRKAHEVRTRMQEEHFKKHLKELEKRKADREAAEKKEAEERAETEKKREAAAGVSSDKGGVAATKGGDAGASGGSGSGGGDSGSSGAAEPGNPDAGAAKKFRVEDNEDDDEGEEDEGEGSSF